MSSNRELNVLSVHSEISEDLVLDRLRKGQISGCSDEVPELTPEIVHETPRIVGQMGPEPILEAMRTSPDFDIMIAGRAYDPSPYVAFTAFHKVRLSGTSFNAINENVLGGFCHMGKILECGGLCATPKSHGAKALIYDNGTFDIAPMDPNARCTPLSVASHTLYEKTRPDILHGPGGALDLTETEYEQLDDGVTVRVKGARFEFSTTVGNPHTVKLEGARVSGYRTLFMGSFKDQILTSQIDSYLSTGKEKISLLLGKVEGNYKLDFHTFGPDPVGEVFIVCEVLADTQELATSVASAARVYCTHGSYEGQLATGGNFAFGIGGKLELEVGPCCEFSVYHLMELKAGEEGGHLIDGDDVAVVPKDTTNKGLFAWKKHTVPQSTSVEKRSYYAMPDAVKGTAHPTPRPTTKANGVPEQPHKQPQTLRDIAKVIRSKNAGPYQITYDVLFDSPHIYNAVKSSGLLSAEVMCRIFDRSDIVWCGFFDQARAFKVTFPRSRGGMVVASGGYGETDVHGSQAYLSLMRLELSQALITALEKLNL